jgi:hypothetical protein
MTETPAPCACTGLRGYHHPGCVNECSAAVPQTAHSRSTETCPAYEAGRIQGVAEGSEAGYVLRERLRLLSLRWAAGGDAGQLDCARQLDDILDGS